jgi:ribosome-binding protein aMBF1 (putative translation factor)
MLAVVKTPRIEIAISGEGAKEALAWLSKKFEIRVISAGEIRHTRGSIPIEDTEFWQVMERNRVGNLLEAARLKAGLAQRELADKAGIRQNMVSDYESGRRKLTKRMAVRLSAVLRIQPERLQ